MSNWLRNWLENQKQTGKFHPSWILLVVAATIIIAGIVWIPAQLVAKAEYRRLPAAALPASVNSASQTRDVPAAIERPVLPARLGPKTIRVDFSPPDVDDIPSGDFGDAVRLGRNIFNDTQTYARAYVGNGLNCVNCHLDEGRKANSAPLWAAYGMFPAYREKNSRVNSYEDRLMGCFRFSMNGKAPPPGSKELIALMSYSYWLSRVRRSGLNSRGAAIPDWRHRSNRPMKHAAGRSSKPTVRFVTAPTGRGRRSAGGMPFHPCGAGIPSMPERE